MFSFVSNDILHDIENKKYTIILKYNLNANFNLLYEVVSPIIYNKKQQDI